LRRRLSSFDGGARGLYAGWTAGWGPDHRAAVRGSYMHLAGANARAGVPRLRAAAKLSLTHDGFTLCWWADRRVFIFVLCHDGLPAMLRCVLARGNQIHATLRLNIRPEAR